MRGVAEEGEQRDRDHDRRDAGIGLGGVDDQRADLEAVKGVGGLHALRVRPEQDQQHVDHDDRDRDQQQELAVLGPRDEGIDHAVLQRIAEGEQHRGDRHQHHQRIEMEGGEQRHRDIHRDRHHLAVGEIDDAHHAEDHRQAERHQAVDQAGQHAADGDIEIDV